MLESQRKALPWAFPQNTYPGWKAVSQEGHLHFFCMSKRGRTQRPAPNATENRLVSWGLSFIGLLERHNLIVEVLPVLLEIIVVYRLCRLTERSTFLGRQLDNLGALNSVFSCFKSVVVNFVRFMFCFMFVNGSFCCFFWAYFCRFFLVGLLWFSIFLCIFIFFLGNVFHSHWLFCIVVFLLQYFLYWAVFAFLGPMCDSCFVFVLVFAFFFYSGWPIGRYRSSFSWS